MASVQDERGQATLHLVITRRTSYNLLSRILHHSPDNSALELISPRQRQHFLLSGSFNQSPTTFRPSIVQHQGSRQTKRKGVTRVEPDVSQVTMSNAKYTPAPQEDPDHAPAGSASFSQAPPAYQAADDEARLFAGGDGVPRSSEDNVPDDFKFGGSVAEATIDIRNQFVRKVYTILTLQLLVTGAVSTISFISPSYKDWIQSHPALVFVSV